MRVRAIIGAIRHGVLPWWMYEEVRHYDCTYWEHLLVNARYAWRWITLNELQSDIDFETTKAVDGVSEQNSK